MIDSLFISSKLNIQKKAEKPAPHRYLEDEVMRRGRVCFDYQAKLAGGRSMLSRYA
jgi:hypothetical protein